MGGSLTGSGSGGGDGALAASSSAMIRRMEARISSIEGSCALAACAIDPKSRSNPAHARVACALSGAFSEWMIQTNKRLRHS
jgi:hypothetical protein